LSFAAVFFGAAVVFFGALGFAGAFFGAAFGLSPLACFYFLLIFV